MRLLSAVVVEDFLGVTRNFWKIRKLCIMLIFDKISSRLHDR